VKYLLAIIVSEIIVIVFFIILPYYVLAEQKSTFLAIGGLLFSVPITYFWRVYTEPVLQIKDEVEQIDWKVKHRLIPEHSLNWDYSVNKIIVENTGRSAAKNCKAWILIGTRKERVCWTIPKERPNATINVKDAERLDFCAYYKEGPETYLGSGEYVKTPKIFPSDENELSTFIDTADLKKLDGLINCIVLITSDNAEPIKAKVIFGEDKIKVEP
jgi:hypothetical protein